MIVRLILIGFQVCIVGLLVLGQEVDSWHQGCFQLVKEHQDGWTETSLTLPMAAQSSEFSFVVCAKHCWQSGAMLVAVKTGARCVCLNETNVLKKITEGFCSEKCAGVQLSLPCGGEEPEARSVYKAAGPYLLNVTTSVAAHWVVSTVPQTLQASAQLASLSNCSKDDDGDEENAWQRKLHFVWEVGGRKVETNVTACTAFPEAHAPFTFLHTGNFTIDLTVWNSVSSVHTSLQVSVVLPQPRDLQLLPSEQSPIHTPSCTNDFFLAPPLSSDVTPSPPLSASPRHSQGPSQGEAGDREGHTKYQRGGSEVVDSVNGHARSDIFAAPQTRLPGQTRPGPAFGRNSLAGGEERPPLSANHGHADLQNGSAGHRTKADNEWTIDDAGDDEGTAMVATFAGQRLKLLAGVSTGVKPSFQVSVVDRLAEVVIKHPFNVTQPAACLAPDCHAVVQELVFPEPGLYTVYVTASNQYGQESAPLTVVVMDRQMGDVEFSVQELDAATYSTDQPVKFYLTVETADRQNSFLYVIFGDDLVGFAPLRETRASTNATQADAKGSVSSYEGMQDFHEEHLGDRAQLLLTGLKLIASYGEGCDLEAEFSYQYSVEGTFTPQVVIINNVTKQTLTERVSSPLVVLNRLSEVDLNASQAAAAGSAISLSLRLQPTSANTSVQWLIEDGWGQVLVNRTAYGTQFSVTFNETGVHTVTADTGNALGKVKASALVLVQKKVQDLQLDCQPFPPRITVEETVECQARVADGSHVSFEWHLEDSVLEPEVDAGNFSSQAAYTFLNPGIYNISVVANNNVSFLMATLDHQVQVDARIRCLCMQTTAVVPDQEVYMNVAALGGTRVNFEYDFGYGRQSHLGDVTYLPPKTAANLSHVFSYPGLYPVTVYALNSVSSAELHSHVVVQPLIGELQLVLQASATVNSLAVLLVQQDGKPAEREDIIFHLHFSDGTRIISASPLVAKNFTHSGKHTVNFTAFNQVDIFSQLLYVEQNNLVYEAGKPSLRHDPIVKQNHEAVFTILECPKSAKVIEVHHSDGTRKVFSANKTKRWSHMFSSPGVHDVEVTIYGGRAGGSWRDRPSLHTILLVQQPITGLRLTGPTRVGIDCYNVWKATVSGGSHMVCRWSLGEEADSTYTTILQYGGSFSTEGIYFLGLHCHNDISNSSAALSITVSYPVTYLHLALSATIHSHPTPITATVYAGHQFTIHFDYGDGTVEEFKSSDIKLVRVSENRPEWQERIPANNISVEHLYAQAGTFDLVVTVSDYISSLTQQKRVFVEEAIKDIEIFADVPDVINVNEQMNWTFEAVLGSGKNLKFAWDFADTDYGIPPVSEGNTSVAVHKFSKAGKYWVTVNVSNHLQKEPVVGQLLSPVTVQAPVTWLTLVFAPDKPTTSFIPGTTFSLQNNRSELVTFEAESDGDPLTFLFEFGDGKSQKVEGIYKTGCTHAKDKHNCTVGHAVHQYISEGVFTVTVTANNALNNLTTTLAHLLYVQVPVKGPLFEHGMEFCTRFGEETVLTATPVHGSNVTFAWKLDDETEFVNAKATVHHKYRLPGQETVEVTASNQVSSVDSFVVVNVVEQIQSVSLKMDRVVAAGEEVTYTAQVLPQWQGLNGHFNWDFSRSEVQTKEPYVKYTYPHSGQYRVTVTAHNCHSSTASVPAEVLVVSRLSGLRIQTSGYSLVNQPIAFLALAYKGDFLNFTWDFGDGSPLVTTKHEKVWHTYNKTKEYIVTVLAENPLGSDRVSHQLFVLSHPCKPPTVFIVGMSGKLNDNMRVLRWQPLRVESQVTVNCTVTQDVNYTWAIYMLTSQDWNGSGIPHKLSNELLHYSGLLLPPHELPLGRFLLTLMVSMKGTEIPVYRKIDLRLEVVRSQIHSIISGGILRTFSSSAIIKMSGEKSNDPDIPESGDLSYFWSCHPLYNSSASCFSTNVPTLNTSHVELEGSWFINSTDSFLFNLSVSAAGSEPANTNQLIQLKTVKHIIPISVECSVCRDNWVNSDQKISLVAHCHGDAMCNHPRLHYQWKVSVVEGDSPQEEVISSFYAYKECDVDDRFLDKSLKLANTTVSSAATTTARLLTTTSSTTAARKLAGSQDPNLNSDSDEPKPQEENPFLPWEGLKENSAPRSRTDHLYTRGESSRNSGRIPGVRTDAYRRGESFRSSGTVDFFSEPAEGTSGSKNVVDPPFDIGEGISEGSSRSRNTAGGFPLPVEGKPIPRHFPPKVPDTSPISQDSPCQQERDSTCVMFKQTQPRPPHITERKNSEMVLNPSVILSDPHGPSLVLQPRTLRQGLTFLVEVTVFNLDDPKAEGMAMTYFSVNKSPRKGTCSLNHKSGNELDTFFKVFCKEWQDEQLPLWYEVSFRLEPDDATPSTASSSTSSSTLPRHVIYRGLSHQISFRLPAGLPQYDRQVFLQLNIRDNWGASTTVCHIPIRVTPKSHHHHINTNATAGDHHHSLRNDLSILKLRLAEGVYRGESNGLDNYEVFSLLVTRLDRLATALVGGNTTTINDTHSLAGTRLRMLETLKIIPLRDQMELSKTLRCLQDVTQSVSQISMKAFDTASKLLKTITQLEKDWRDASIHSVTINHDMAVNHDVTLVIQVVSNLLQAVTQSPLIVENTHIDRLRLLSTKRALAAMHDMLSLALRDHSLGEFPLLYHTKFTSVTASHYPVLSPLPVNINKTTFQLPRNMSSVLKRPPNSSPEDGKEQSEDSLCFQARATSFQQNPFIYRQETDSENIEVQSEVVSLDIFSCNGSQSFTVEKLKPDNNVEFDIPVMSNVKSDLEFHLSRAYMNIHQFNISHSQANLYLTLLVNLAPLPAFTRPFPITAVISSRSPPHPQHNLLRQDFPKDADQLRIFLTPGSLRGAGTYYFGLVETSLNSVRRPKAEVSTRHYTLNAWFGSCLFWNESSNHWSSQGCHVTLKTTATTVNCRCNHLTAFGSHFELVPNDLSFADTEQFFGLHENPVVVILVSIVLLVYIVLLVIAIRADSHDSKKGGLVCLSDNNISDSQVYEIVLDTGLCQRTPTTAKISIILHGELGMSETRELISEDDRPMFDRSSRDRFLITLPDSLGRITKVQLWHNNAGTSPRWFLSQVLVRDLNTGKVQYFLCDKWFAVDEGDGRVERELAALDNNVTFMQIFIIKGRQFMADFHTWGSIFTRPAYSHFTRAQRLTCCLTLLLAYMALNAAWYKKQPEQPRGEFGLLDVSWQNLSVGAICCAVIFPLNLFLAFLFRRSRRSHSDCQHKLETSSRIISTANTTSHSAATTYPDNLNINSDSISHYAETADMVTVSQTMTTYSLLDQSILNWQSIQDWAQRQWIKRQQSTRPSAVSVKTHTQPCPTQPVQHTLLADEETDQASSGFEDAVSQATAERHRIKPASESSFEGQQSHTGEDESGGPHIFLPAWCHYIAWTLCVLVCIVSATITILYGFRFGPTKSIFWLQSLYFSFTICIFFAQPFWIIFTVVCLALKNRNNPAVFDHCCERNQVQEGISAWRIRQKQLLESSDDSTELERGVRARQRSRYLRFSRPPQEKFLQESRKNLMKEKNAAKFLREVVVFLLMFTVVCVMAYGKDFSHHFRLKQSLDTILLRSGSQSFHTIKQIPDWHRWAQSTLLDALYGTRSMPGLLMKAGENQGNNVLVGHPLLRQLRVQQQPCAGLLHFTNSTEFCRYEYSTSNEDVDNSSAVWMSPAEGSRVWGQMAVYDAGGYGLMLNQSRMMTFVCLSGSKEEALRQLQELEFDGWLDRKSRAVIVEMTVLNVPTSLFCSGVLLLELPPSGGAFPSPRITSTYLFRYVTTWDHCVLACELLFVLLALMKIQSELSAMIQEGRRYFTWPWNCAQLLLCITALGYIVCFIYRFLLVSEAVDFLRNTYYEQFISLAFLAAWDELLRSIVGLLVFLVVVTQGLRLLRYCPHLAKFTAVYKRGRREVTLMALLFCIITVAFSNLGSLLFGSLSWCMRTSWSASLAVVALATGIYSPPELDADRSLWFPIFAMFFSTMGCGLITAYAVAILTHRLRANKHGDLLVMGKCELLDYCLQQMLLFIGVQKHMPVHEPQVDLPPECTLAEFEYQVEELLFRMNALAGTTNLPEKPTGYLTDSDQSQAVGDDGISSGGSEPAVDHSGNVASGEEDRLEMRVQKIEDKLYANEPYLAQLLKLDSIGANVLSQEKEKKLRSHLEMEIFRQLQMRRQESGNGPGASDASTFAVSSTLEAPTSDLKVHLSPSHSPKFTTALSSRTAEGLSGMDSHLGAGRINSEMEGTMSMDVDIALMQTSSDDSPKSERAHLFIASDDPELIPSRTKTRSKAGTGGSFYRKSSKPQMLKSKVISDELEYCSEEVRSGKHYAAEFEFSEPGHSMRKQPAEAFLPLAQKAECLQASGGHRSEASCMERSNSMGRNQKRLVADLTINDMERSDSLRGSRKKHFTDQSGIERSDSLHITGKRHPNDLAVSPMERSHSLRSAGRKAELPPKPTFAVVPMIDSKRSPKPPSLKMPTERTLHRTEIGQPPVAAAFACSGSAWRGDAVGSGQLGESSSGSEQDGLLSVGGMSAGGRRSQSQGRRNLRKTKSRGKGKGAGTLTPTLLLDELSFTVHHPPKQTGEIGYPFSSNQEMVG